MQIAAGARQVQHRLAAIIKPLQNADRVLDLGGGTGLHRDLWNAECAYICLDNDSQKLQGFRARHADGLAILGDATKTPIRSNSMDVVMCTFVAHHISDDLLDQFIGEAMRMLKDGGSLIFLDPLLVKRRAIGRLLWKYDRGSNPRTASQLRRVLLRHGKIQQSLTFSILHTYWLCVLVKPLSE